MGYFGVPNWIVEQTMKELDNSSLRVLLSLMRHANDKGTCYPSLQTMANEAGLSREMVKRAIRKLRDSGYVTYSQPSRGTSNHYQLHERIVEDSKKQVG